MNQAQRWLASCAVGAVAMSAAQAQAQTTSSNSITQPTHAPASGGQTSGAEQATQRAQQTTQNVEASSASNVGELVVTAEAHQQTLQHIPIAVSDYTDERRNLVGIENESDIVNFTPSMSLNGQFLSLRGVGRYTDELGTDPGVAVFVDGIYTNSPDYLNQPDFFSDRIEILRGPQGTENGRNAIGGVVNVVEKRPTPDFHEEVRVGYNNYNYNYDDVAISGPITNTLEFRAAYAYGYQPPWDGYVKNLAAPDQYPGAGQSRLAEFQLQWKPTSNFEAWFKVQSFSSNNNASYGVMPGEYPSINSYSTPISLAATAPSVLPPTSNPVIHNPWVIDSNVPGNVKLSNDWTFTLHLTWDQPWGTIKYIGGYSQYKYSTEYDFDQTPIGATPYPYYDQIVSDFQTHEWYQNEVEIASNDTNRLKWTAGVFQYWEKYLSPYYEEEPYNTTLLNPVTSCAAYPACPAAAPNPQSAFYNQISSLHSQSQAVFGQVDYDVTDTLRLTGGMRYNWDQKQGYTQYRYVYDVSGIYFAPGLPGEDVTPTPNSGTQRASWQDWSGKLGAEWRPDSSTMTYLTLSKGYKSGGMILGNIVPIPTVGPETLYSAEVGIKKTVMENLLINADAFYYNYHNLQQVVNVQNGSIVSADLMDAQKARTFGFELESVWSPIRDFHLTVNYSYLNARFTEFTNTLSPGTPLYDTAVQPYAGCVTSNGAACPGMPHSNLNGNVIPQSPTNKLTINPLYTVHLERAGDLTFSATYAFVGKQYYGVFTEPEFLAPSYSDLDLRLLYQPHGGHYTFILFARNVTNALQIVNYGTGSFYFGPANLIGAGATYPSSGQPTYYVNPPRTFGGEIQVRF